MTTETLLAHHDAPFAGIPHYDACPYAGVTMNDWCPSCALIHAGVALGREAAATDIAGFRTAMQAARQARWNRDGSNEHEARVARWTDGGMRIAEGVARSGYRPHD